MPAVIDLMANDGTELPQVTEEPESRVISNTAGTMTDAIAPGNSAILYISTYSE